MALVELFSRTKCAPFRLVIGLCLLISTLPPANGRRSDGLPSLDIRSNERVEVKDNWKFRYASRLDDLKSSKDTLVSLPFHWTSLSENARQGYGQYAISLVNPGKSNLGLLFPFVNTELQVYANSKLVFQSKFYDPENPVPFQPGKMRPLIKLPADSLLNITVIVRNQHAFRPGLRRSPVVSAYTRIQYEEEKRKSFELLGLGILMIIAIYHLLLYGFLRTSAHLWLALISLIVFIRGSVVYDGFFVLYEFFPALQFSLAKRLEYGFLYWTPGLMLLLFQSQFGVMKYDRFIKWVFSFCAILFLIVCVARVHVFERTLYAFHLLALVCFFVSLDIVRKAMMERLPTARTTLLGLSIAFVLAGLEILKNYGLVHLDFGSNLLNNAVVLYIIIQAVALSAQMARVYKENEYLNRNLEESVEKKTIELSEANAAKAKILAVVSHDLRSPLASLNGSLQLLEMDIFEKSKFERVKQDITDQLSHNTRMIQEVLQWSSIELKKETAATCSSICQLGDASMQAIRQVRQLAQEKQVKLINEVRSMEVQAELEVLIIILRNLIANAVKFTDPHGTVQITAKVFTGKTKVCVVDNGVGITDDMKQLILHSHSTKSRRGTRSEKGTGVGLLIVKDLLHQLGSHLEIVDNPDAATGTIFSFELKRA